MLECKTQTQKINKVILFWGVSFFDSVLIP